MKRFPAMRLDAKDAGVRPISPDFSKTIAAALRSKRLDGWENVITGAGVRGRDKRLGGQLSWNGLMAETTAEQTYAASELARRIIELPAQGALTNWIKFENMDDQAKAVEDELSRLKAEAKFYEASCWADLYGGSALFMATGEDPEDFKLPLDPTKIDRIESLVLFSKWELLVTAPDLETDINNPNYGNPKYYNLTPRKGNVSTLFSVKIHHSRLIIFMGKALPLRLKVFNRYWGDSVYTGVTEALRDYSLSHASIASVMQEFRTVTYKMKELTEALGSVDSQALQDRMAAIMAVKSVFGMYFLDMDEEIDIKSDTFTGVDSALQALKDYLQAHTNIPHILLFNESPGGSGGGGLGQSGDSSLKLWYNYLAGRQKNYYTDKLDQLLVPMMLAPGGPTEGQEPDGWDYKWNSPETMSDGDKEDLESKQHDNDSKAMANGLDSQLDVLERRRPEKFRAMGFSEDAKMAAAAAALEAAEGERFGLPSQVQEKGKDGKTVTKKQAPGTSRSQPLTTYRDQVKPTSSVRGPVGGPAKAEKKPKK